MSCSDIAGVWKKRIEEKNNIFSEQRKAKKMVKYRGKKGVEVNGKKTRVHRFQSIKE